MTAKLLLAGEEIASTSQKVTVNTQSDHLDIGAQLRHQCWPERPLHGSCVPFGFIGNLRNPSDYR